MNHPVNEICDHCFPDDGSSNMMEALTLQILEGLTMFEVIVPPTCATVNSTGKCGVVLMCKQFTHAKQNNHVDYCCDLEDNEERRAIDNPIFHSPTTFDSFYDGMKLFNYRRRSCWPLVIDINNSDEVSDDEDDNQVPELIVC